MVRRGGRHGGPQDRPPRPAGRHRDEAGDLDPPGQGRPCPFPPGRSGLAGADQRHAAAFDGKHQALIDMTWLPPALAPIVLLTFSNVFMTFAWYGHLKFTDRPLWLVIIASWGIAFIEYCFAVPANRWGSAIYSAAERKTMQEASTLSVFAAFSVPDLGERITVDHAV